jgi:predicted Fe-Mo cluster-binding NifX family protein
MKIAITATGKDLQSQVDPRFGRCANFIIYDVETGASQVYPNSGVMAAGGAGSQAAQTVADTGAEAVVTGNLGPNAARALEELKIPVFKFDSGTVEQAIKQYKEGKLPMISGPTVASHAGMRKS